jgi:hypothetical protein
MAPQPTMIDAMRAGMLGEGAPKGSTTGKPAAVVVKKGGTPPTGRGATTPIPPRKVSR